MFLSSFDIWYHVVSPFFFVMGALPQYVSSGRAFIIGEICGIAAVGDPVNNLFRQTHDDLNRFEPLMSHKAFSFYLNFNRKTTGS